MPGACRSPRRAEDVAKVARSYTGQYLKDIIARSEQAEAAPAMKPGKVRARAPKRGLRRLK